jgi:hypothetical protein
MANVQYITYNHQALQSSGSGEGYSWKTWVLIAFMVMMLLPALLREF